MTSPIHDTPANLAERAADAWPSILELGRLAPTPHNTQWYFLRVIDSETARVCIDESIAIPFTDPNDQFRYTGLGVFARHLELAASAAGFELQTTFDELDGTGPVVARIVGHRAPDGALAARLRSRQTSRFAYRAEPVSDAAISAVEALGDRNTSLTNDDGPADRDGGAGAQQRTAARRPRGRGYEPRARPLDPVHEAVPPALPQRLHTGVAGDSRRGRSGSPSGCGRCCDSVLFVDGSRRSTSHRTAPPAWGGSTGRWPRVANSSRRAAS